MKTLLLLGALAAPSFALAADEPVRLDPITTTATRTAAKPEDVLAAQLVISREEIERAQAHDVAELLRSHAGFEIGRTGGVGAVTSVFTRGGESDHTLVLVDGVAINPDGFGAQFANLAPEMIERIEIVKGPRSTLYGSAALAGVINIITRKSAQPVGFGLTVRGGGDATRQVAGQIAVGDEHATLVLNAEAYRSEGYEFFSTLPELRRGAERDSVSLNAGTRIGAVDVRLRGLSAETQSEYVGGFPAGPLDQGFATRSAALELAAQPTSIWTTQLTASLSRDEINNNQNNSLGQKDFAHTRRPRLDWHHSLQLGSAHRVSAALAYERTEVESLSFGTVVDNEKSLRSLSLQDEIRMGRHRALFGLAASDYEGFGGVTTWNAEYGFDLFERTRLSLAAGTGFRAPSASERFGFGGNAALEPEESRSLEAAYIQGLGKDLALEVRWFRNEVEELISTQCDAFFNCTNFNIDEARNTGTELSFKGSAGAFDFRLGGVVQKPRSETAVTDGLNSRRLLRRADRSANASVVWNVSRYTLGLEAIASSDRQDFSEDTDFDFVSDKPTVLPGYAVLNLNASAKLTQNATLRLRGENLLDKDYATAANAPALYLMPGALAYATLELKF